MNSRIDFSNPQDSAAPRLRHAFGAPRQVLVALTLGEVRPLLDAVEAAARQGSWCLGYLRYEAAPAFDTAFTVHPADGPLAWFGVHDAPLSWPEAEAEKQAAQAADVAVEWPDDAGSQPAFAAAFGRIVQAIGAGELYQVNLTAQLAGVWAASQTGEAPHGAAQAEALFAALQRAQPGGYAAYIDTGNTLDAASVGATPTSADGQVLSVSPELFFDWHAGALLARPMKGTAARGATPALDAAQAEALRSSSKERAENVMIVDLLRNDVSRIAEPFSVQVPQLFATQALPSVWQMTSDVRARTRPGTSLADVFGALFPCGSITGAPKVQAMRMIRDLEAGPRGVYCGALGLVRPAPGASGAPGIHAIFNVPIRTVTVRGNALACGIGSGITSSAELQGEWQEWRYKRSFLERASAPFELLETLALDSGQLRHLPLHLARMAAAALHFSYVWNEATVRVCLAKLVHTHPQGLWRVRLLLSAYGVPTAEAFALEPTAAPVRLQLATRPMMAAHSELTRFKTTRRAHYDAFAPTDAQVFDTVLWNTDREITECIRGNVAMLLEGRWVTPPLRCGLLGGVGRAVALQDGRLTEAVVLLEDLARVEGWAFLNSLRGWVVANMD